MPGLHERAVCVVCVRERDRARASQGRKSLNSFYSKNRSFITRAREREIVHESRVFDLAPGRPAVATGCPVTDRMARKCSAVAVAVAVATQWQLQRSGSCCSRGCCNAVAELQRIGSPQTNIRPAPRSPAAAASPAACCWRPPVSPTRIAPPAASESKPAHRRQTDRPASAIGRRQRAGPAGFRRRGSDLLPPRRGSDLLPAPGP